MKARVKATGKIVDATYWNTSANGIKYYDIDNSGNTMTEDELDFDFSYTPDYWTRLEHTYAGMAMQGILSGDAIVVRLAQECTTELIPIVVGEMAHSIAHALVEKMKEVK